MTLHSDLTHSLAEAEALCARKGVSLTPIRKRVLELLLDADGPVKAYDLLAQLKPGAGAAQPPTVYRALDFLVSTGLAHKVESLNAYTACIHGEEAGGPVLFICEKCGAVQEQHAHAKLKDMPEGFQLTRSVVEHYGLCANCQAA
ncbi:transcriptional repressor [Woodsholea maritima]|uniref:transcriptional repressor n=1 Tax=Woodsholea maritima TaxID=240237 RepID=UPI000366C825|nr:transcriptional repressor [Woodsholea maritima]